MKLTRFARFIDLVSAIFIVLFIYTALAKLTAHRRFEMTIQKSFLIGFAAPFLSWAIPLIELVAALLLFLPAFRTEGFLATFFLMLLFTFYIACMLLAASRLPCSCGGIIASLSWWQHLWLNVVLSSISYIGFIYSKRLKILLQ